MNEIKAQITEIQSKSTDDVVKELAKTTLALAVEVVPDVADPTTNPSDSDKITTWKTRLEALKYFITIFQSHAQLPISGSYVVICDNRTRLEISVVPHFLM